MNLLRHIIFRRQSLYTGVTVLLLFAILPLSQRMMESVQDDTVTLRSVDVAPPPPPPPQQREDADPGAISQAGVNLKSIIPAVNLDPLPTGASSILANSMDLGLNEIDITPQADIAFNMKGIGFGPNGLDRPLVMIVRPRLRSGYLERAGIAQFETRVLVKILVDGTLSLITIEEIEYPNPEFGRLVHEAIAGIRYPRPTIDGMPTERFLRLDLTIYAD